MPARYEVRLAGTGGQGQVLASIILAEALAIYEGKEVVQSQDYGPESRGGASKADVVVGETDYPKALHPDVLVAMSPSALRRYGPEVKEGGTVLVDETWISREEARSLVGDASCQLIFLPLTRLALERCGRALVANVVALGALAALGVVSLPALERAVRSRVPRGAEEANLCALRAGFEAAAGAAGI